MVDTVPFRTAVLLSIGEAGRIMATEEPKETPQIKNERVKAVLAKAEAIMLKCLNDCVRLEEARIRRDLEVAIRAEIEQAAAEDARKAKNAKRANARKSKKAKKAK